MTGRPVLATLEDSPAQEGIKYFTPTEVGDFSPHKNVKLFYRGWTAPVDSGTEVKGVMIYVHGAFANGLDAHILAETLVPEGIFVFALDQRGWGKRSKTPGHITSKKTYPKDQFAFVKWLKERFPGSPFFIFGHSMGGLVVLNMLTKDPSPFAAAAICAPWLGNKVKINPLVLRFSKLAAAIYPKFSQGLPFKLHELTHDQQILEGYRQQRKQGIRRVRATVGLLRSVMALQRETKRDLPKINLPVIWFQGGQDTLVSAPASLKGYQKISSEKKYLFYRPDFLHEVFSEIGREEPLGLLKDFFLQFFYN